MSRCFPFPPPGYEKKAKFDDTDLLEKEKSKEKKHKKDKKKEKKESKEKKDRDKSKKHREKKDRKEKHKEDGKYRDEDRKRTKDEKQGEGQPEYHNSEKIGSNSLENSEITDSLYVEELARRIRDEDGASRSQMVQKVAAADQRRGEIREMVAERSISNQPQEERKVKNKNMVVEKIPGDQSYEKEKVKNKNEDPRKVNVQRNYADTSGREKTFGQSSFGMDRERAEGIVKLVEKKDTDKQMGEKERNKQKDSGSKSEKKESRDREKSRKSKDKDKKKEITEPSKEQPKLKENASKLIDHSKDPLDFRNIKSSETLKVNSASPVVEANLGKRKEPERNGYLLDHGNRPNKVSRPVPSSYLVAENGKKLETCQTAVQVASEKQGLTNNYEVDIKERKINGLMKAEVRFNGSIKEEKKINGLITADEKISNGLTAESSTKSRAIGVAVPSPNDNGVIFSRPPHPDTKHLGQILSLPEMVEWPGVDDQQWLLSCNRLQSRDSPGGDGTQQVWAEAIRIDSADISALPYVIPY